MMSHPLTGNPAPQIISGHPPILSYSVDSRLRPFWEYLQSLGIADVAEVVVNRPSLFGLDVEKNLKKIVDYLQYTETPPEAIAKYLIKSI